MNSCGSPAPARTRASLRGITSGIRRSGSTPIIGTCWVFLTNNVAPLLGALQFQALTVTHVVLPDAVLLPTVRSLVPPAASVFVGSHLQELPSLPCNLAVVSPRVHPAFLDALQTAGVTAVLALRGAKRFHRPWERTKLVIPHSSLGGVTETRLEAHLLTTAVDWTTAALGPPSVEIPRDLSTLLSYNEPVLRNCPQPALQEVSPLCAHQTMLAPSTGLPVYHSRGLLPPSPNLSTLIQAPHKFGWGIRSLSRAELLQAYDIGDRFGALLPDSYDPSGSTPVSTVVEALKRTAPIINSMRGGNLQGNLRDQDHRSQAWVERTQDPQD